MIYFNDMQFCQFPIFVNSQKSIEFVIFYCIHLGRPKLLNLDGFLKIWAQSLIFLVPDLNYKMITMQLGYILPIPLYN